MSEIAEPNVQEKLISASHELPEIGDDLTDSSNELPVVQAKAEIMAELRKNQVLIVAGETGSGKTTQLPQMVMELFSETEGTGEHAGKKRQGIAHTQPRRIAARTVAARIADELNSPLGERVGFQIRFTDETSANTELTLMTDGILLAQIQHDPQLSRYHTIIIDEAHERSLNIDFLLGYLAKLLPKRPDLKLIITSATIDFERFANHFAEVAAGSVSVVEVSGRSYPVEVRYRPLAKDDDITSGVTKAVSELISLPSPPHEPQDILVFLSGEREISDVADVLTGRFKGKLEIVPLYSRLSAAEQLRVFQPHSQQRVVLATNIAETSITVPGIKYVIDSGLARISRYSKTTKVQRLPIEAISQASAKQRSGRCGRLAPGIAIRLYSEEDFNSRVVDTEPEILRTSLASVALQILAVGVLRSPAELTTFPFIDRPDGRAIRDAISLLLELAALRLVGKDKHRLTGLGRKLAKLPVDPRLARMILESKKHSVSYEVIVIAAALSIQDPKERPAEEREKANLQHRRFADPTSDFLSYLNLWRYLQEQQRTLSKSAFRRLCKSEYLNYLRVREWQDLVAQIRQLAKAVELQVTASKTDTTGLADQIHRSVLAGLLSQIGYQITENQQNSTNQTPRKAKRERKEYQAARGAKFQIHPASAMSRSNASWVMASELVETSRLFARDVAKIEPSWAEEIAGPQMRYSYSDPSWSAKKSAAIVLEKALLFGLPIVQARPVLLSKFDSELARRMFIENALVRFDWRSNHKFLAVNKRQLEIAERVEEQQRSKSLLVDDDALYEFFSERLPATITSGTEFDKWWRKQQKITPGVLNYTQELLLPEKTGISRADYPERWEQNGLSFPLRYKFSPGDEEDGVTAEIPLLVLNQVTAAGFDWLVPGLLPELVLATIKGLPKATRVKLVPAPDTARQVLNWIEAKEPEGSFLSAFASAVREIKGEILDEVELAKATLPAHLRTRFEIKDSDGKVAGSGRSLLDLQQRLASRTETSLKRALQDAVKAAAAEQSGVSKTVAKGVSAVGYLGLQHNSAGNQAELQVFADEGSAQAAHSEAVAELLLAKISLSQQRVATRLSSPQQLLLHTARYPDSKLLYQDIQRAALLGLVAEKRIKLAEVRTEDEIEGTARILKPFHEEAVYQVMLQTLKALQVSGEVSSQISRMKSLATLATVNDVKAQLDSLIYPGFISKTPTIQLASLARFLSAAKFRLERAEENNQRDRSLQTQLDAVELSYQEAEQKVAKQPVALRLENQAVLTDAQWLIEEYAVSLFAQHLGTRVPVSPQRINKLLAKIKE